MLQLQPMRVFTSCVSVSVLCLSKVESFSQSPSSQSGSIISTGLRARRGETEGRPEQRARPSTGRAQSRGEQYSRSRERFANYDESRNRGLGVNPFISESGASSDGEGRIECPQADCPGCVHSDFAKIDIIESAKLYFSSLSVQKHIIQRNKEGFFKVVIPSSITQWRSQAKLAVAPCSTWSSAAGCKIGLFKRYSHDVIAIPDCQAHHPNINHAIEVITKATKKVRTPGYEEFTGEGFLRYVQCQVELSTGKVCLSLVVNRKRFKDTQPHLMRLVKELKRRDPELWHSIWVHCNDSVGNAIFARDASRWHQLQGPPYVRESIPGSDPDKMEGLLYFSPHVFRQGNLEGFGKLIAKEVREAIPSGSKVCELYAGVGLLGLSALLHHGKLADKYEDSSGLAFLRCSDSNPANVKCFERAVCSLPKHMTGLTPKSFNKNGKKNKRRSGKRGRKEVSLEDLMKSMEKGGSDDDPDVKVTYICSNAASALHQGQALGADVIMVDPPRKGLDEAVLEQLCKPHNPNQLYAENPTLLTHLPRHTVNWTNDARSLIYVSCGFDALARDCDKLVGSPALWKLESATGYILFPGSNHIETVVIFRR